MAVPVSPHDPTQMPVELAEMIGQLQHIIDLQEALIGRNVYDPLVIDLHIATSQIFNLPAEAHQIETVQVSSDTAVTVKVYRVDQYSGPSGKLIGQVYIPAASAAPPLQLNCPIPPTQCQLLITTSAAVTTGACVVTLARSRSGGFPYAS